MVRTIVERLMFGLCLDTPDGAGGGGGNSDGNPGADNNGDHKPGNDDTGAQKLPAGKSGAAPDKPAEDPRIKGFLADLQKERQQRQKWENDYKTAQAELERERKRVMALAGVNPKSDEEAEEELVRARLAKLLPGASSLTAEDIAEFKALKAEIAEMRAATNQTWKTHSQKMLSAVTSGVEKALGGKLSDRQIARVERAYVAEAESNPDFLARHEAGDPKLAEEFVKEWIEDFVEPGKRQALAVEIGRRPRVPSGKDRSIVGSDQKPIDVKDDNAVADFLVKSFREKGGQFGRR